ncbi:hypothetical protein [Kumtagia ephedrae]|uniref:Uncharacterized protein n=1 Tax=Kumtagia ephedrae TaxID=2116701 RepID=A0A2P7RPQ9_9HYPH|nr:hypothetical protein [Mesorhizobium ephedrae]PSJ52165.1 hypothetical protein C7I84_26580 [Mesorhizobium ephedrae]
MPIKRAIPAHVRAAIATFLHHCQSDAAPFAGTEALGAIRTMFPELDISDADLEDAISGEAANAGFDVGCETRTGSARAKRKALERWDNEGGAIGKTPRMETLQRTDNDANGTRRKREIGKDGNI